MASHSSQPSDSYLNLAEMSYKKNLYQLFVYGRVHMGECTYECLQLHVKKTILWMGEC